jgi:hypothetical protein
MKNGLPEDLAPLPTQPWDVRPAELPLDVEECRTAIWRNSGNITRAASLLKIHPARLRAFVKQHDRLRREVEEAAEQLIDKAEDVVAEALDDPDRADQMARFVLQTRGKSRGWGNSQPGNVNIQNTGPIQISWQTGDTFTPGDGAKVIEGEVSVQDAD